jgi:hypothetical protein
MARPTGPVTSSGSAIFCQLCERSRERYRPPSPSGAACYYKVQSSRRIGGQAPGGRLRRVQAVVAGRPRRAAVGRLENAFAEPGHIQDPSLGGTAAIQQDMSRGDGRGPQHMPGDAPVIAAQHSTPAGRRRSAPPHLGPRQIVNAAHYGPHPAPHVGVEFHPVSRIDPSRRNSPGGEAGPTASAVLAPEQSYIGVGDEHAPRIERVEMNSVAGRDIEPGGTPAPCSAAARVRRQPGPASVLRLQRAAHVGGIADPGIGGRHRQP